MKPTLNQFYVSTLTPEAIDAVITEYTRNGPMCYENSLVATAPYGFGSSPFSFIPDSLSEEGKIALLSAFRGMVMAVLSNGTSRDDFVNILTNMYGLSRSAAENLVSSKLSFEDYDASSMIRALMSHLPAATGGAATEILASLFDVVDKITPDSWQQNQDYSLRLWRDFGKLLMTLHDDALLTAVVINKSAQKPASSGGTQPTASDSAIDTGMSLLQTASLIAAGLSLLTPLRGRALPYLMKRLRFGGAGAAGALKGAPNLGLPQLPGIGDLYADAEDDDDTAYMLEDENELVVVPELGHLLVHPGVEYEQLINDPRLRDQAAKLAIELAEQIIQLKAGRIEEGGFLKGLARVASPFISEAMTAAGGGIGSFFGPGGTAAGAALGKWAGDKIEKEVRGNQRENDARERARESNASAAARSMAIKRASNRPADNRLLTRILGSKKADFVDAMRAPAVVHGMHANPVIMGRLTQLIAAKGSRASAAEIAAAMRA